MYRLANNSMKY